MSHLLEAILTHKVTFTFQASDGRSIPEVLLSVSDEVGVEVGLPKSCKEFKNSCGSKS